MQAAWLGANHKHKARWQSALRRSGVPERRNGAEFCFTGVPEQRSDFDFCHAGVPECRSELADSGTFVPLNPVFEVQPRATLG